MNSQKFFRNPLVLWNLANFTGFGLSGLAVLIVPEWLAQAGLVGINNRHFNSRQHCTVAGIEKIGFIFMVMDSRNAGWITAWDLNTESNTECNSGIRLADFW